MTSGVTCLGCGCACDDIEIVLAGDRIAEARHACELGARWFGDGRVPARTVGAGRDTTLEQAVAQAAAVLRGASAPLVYIATDLSCEAQREAVGIADVLRARLDSTTSASAMRSILAAQERGRAGATLGEIRNRADLLVFWGVDPAVAYPRYLTRYAPDAPGVHVPRGRVDRTVIAVDVGSARGPADADHRLAVDPAEEVAALTGIRAGTHELAAMLRRGRYVVIVADAEAGASGDPGRAEALIALARSLNDHTRCALSVLRGGGNRSGADACLTWQTGYPIAIDFARGTPQYRPHDGVRPDVTLVVGSRHAVRDLPASRLVVIGPRASEGSADVTIDTAVAGIHEEGTALRLDDVPLPLRAVLGGPPRARDVLRAVRAAL